MLAGVTVGLAFNVKLLEGLVAVPALALLYAIAAPVPRRRRVADITLAVLALVLVSLSWATAVTLAPGRHPFPIGSNGRVFDVIFGFNGLGRLAGALTAGGMYSAPPGVFRLLSDVADIGQLFGVMLVPAVALGGAALMLGLRRAHGDSRRRRLKVAFAVAVVVWLASAISVLSYVSVLHARYLEMVTPAVAITAGCGLASLISAALGTGHRARVAVAAFRSARRRRSSALSALTRSGCRSSPYPPK